MKYSRGNHPNSKYHKLSDLGSKGHCVTLSPEDWEIIEALGEGNRSKGVRVALEYYKKMQAENACIAHPC